MPRKEPDEEVQSGDEEEEWWGDLLGRIDSPGFSSTFRSLVLVAALLRVREESEAALADLRTIMQETDTFSKRIVSAKIAHPDVKILGSIEKNLGTFSIQTTDFEKTLGSSELRGELELMTLCIVLSRSRTVEIRERKAKFARKLTKFIRHAKRKEDDQLRNTGIS